MKQSDDNRLLDWARSIYGCENSKKEVKYSMERSLTKRGVLWLGQTCNLRCFFCYFVDKIADREHPEHAFMSLEKAKDICRTLREVYGNTNIDIQGGEPTIYPYIYELVSYCSSIGLRPTLITNAIALANPEKVVAYKDAGINDFLVSTHALGDTFDSIVGLKGGSEKQLKGLYNLRKYDISFRLNCTLTAQALRQLDDIAVMAEETGAGVVNFIAFNPFADQQGAKRSTENVPRYSDIRRYITKPIDRLEAAGIEVNVRYLPICMLAKRHRKNMYNFQQLSYDPREWDFNSWTWTTRFNQRSAGTELDETVPILLYNIPEYGGINFGKTSEHGTREHYMRDIDVREHLLKMFSSGIPKELVYRHNAMLRAEKHCKYTYGDACSGCSIKGICDGFHSDYNSIFGTEEASPVRLGRQIDDPKYYIAGQRKVSDE